MAVPFGRVTNNALLGNIGPDIPIDFTTIGHVNTDIKQKIEPHGINTTAIQIIMEMEVTLQVIIPFHTKEIKSETKCSNCDAHRSRGSAYLLRKRKCCCT